MRFRRLLDYPMESILCIFRWMSCLLPYLFRGVNYCFDGRIWFGFLGFFWDFLGFFWAFFGIFPISVREFFRVIYPSIYSFPGWRSQTQGWIPSRRTPRALEEIFVSGGCPQETPREGKNADGTNCWTPGSTLPTQGTFLKPAPFSPALL